LFNASGNDKRTGSAIVLKVMSGDKFKAAVRGWYLPGTPAILQQVLNAFVAALPGGSKIGAAQGGLASGAIGSFLSSHQTTPPANRPKAYLNWMLLDEQQLKLDVAIQGSVLVPAITGTTQAQLMQAAGGAEITIPKNGYLFIFISNESQGSVYFDDLTIQHTPGNLLEEHYYYPTGLEMFALSSSATNGHVRSRLGYQGQEHENTFALNLNEFEARHYDPQTGRWMVPDPALQFPSPYVGMGNQWVSGVDPDGRAVLFVGAKLVGALIGGIANMIANKDQIKMEYAK